MATTTQLMTAAEFFDWAQRPENAGRRFELERGRVVEMSRGGERHGVVCINVGYVLSAYIRRRRRGFAAGNDTGVILEREPDTVRGPDVIYYDENRRYVDLNPRYSDDPPTLVVEVLSPHDKANQVVKRVAQFLRWGVKMVWVIDPEGQTVAVYRPGQFPEVLDREEELDGGDTLPEFRVRCDEFFFLAGELPPA